MIVDLPGRAAAGQAVELASAGRPGELPVFAWQDSASASRDAGIRSLVRDAALAVLTLGLHRCWVRTRTRRRIWSSIQLDGVALRYAGTVRDLLLPALALLGGILAVGLAIWIAKLLAVPKPRITPTPWRFVVTVPLIYLLGLAAWRHRAFLIEHTVVGRMAGRLDGSRHAYARLHFLTAFAVPLTLGWIIPFRQVMMQRQLIEAMQLGPHRFTFDGNARALLGRFGIAWLGVIGIYLGAVLAIAFSSVGARIAIAKQAGALPVLAVGEVALACGIAAAAGLVLAFVLAWYRIGLWRHLASSTFIDGRRLRLEAATGDYLALFASNMALRSGSLYLLSAVAEERQARFLVSRLKCA